MHGGEGRFYLLVKEAWFWNLNSLLQSSRGREMDIPVKLADFHNRLLRAILTRI